MQTGVRDAGQMSTSDGSEAKVFPKPKLVVEPYQRMTPAARRLLDFNMSVVSHLGAQLANMVRVVGSIRIVA